LRVGDELQTVGYFNLEAAPPSPVQVTVTIANEAVALVSKTETVQGAKTITYENVATIGANYFAVQGLAEGQGTTLTVSAPGYSPLVYTVEVDPSGFVMYQPGANFATTPFSANTTINLTAMRLVRGTNAYGSYQEVRGGLTVPVPVTSSNTAVGVITVSPVNVSATQNNSDFNLDAISAFDPLANGLINVAITQPAGFETISNPSNNARVTVAATVSGGLPAGQTNLSRLPGTTAVASTEYSVSYTPSLAIDGVNATTSSWCTANNDPAPKLTVNFPNSSTVRNIVIVTSWSPTYDFLTGRFRVLTAADAVLHDSGVVALTNGAISYDVPAGDEDPGARKVEFTGVTWSSIEPCLSEIAIGGSVP
jgi:hypothetical protein